MSHPNSPPEDPFPLQHATLRLPGFTLFSGAEGGREVGSREQPPTEVAFASPSSAEKQARPPGSSPNPKEEKRKRGPGPLLPSPRGQADFQLRVSCAQWHALSAPRGPGACLPRCCPRRRPISAATMGPRHASPLLPRGAQLDAGQRAEVGKEERPLCLLSPGGLCPSNSRLLKEPRPVRRALSGSCLAVPDHFASIPSFLGTCSEPLLVP